LKAQALFDMQEEVELAREGIDEQEGEGSR
jgi:hypothetical protein